jgi:hypothetical protein
LAARVRARATAQWERRRYWYRVCGREDGGGVWTPAQAHAHTVVLRDCTATALMWLLQRLT